MNCSNSFPTLRLLILVALLVLVQWESVSSSEWRCREEERSVLLQIKAAIPDPIHSLYGKWEGKECCRWERVTCDRTTGHVTKLDLGVALNGGCISLNASMFLPLRQLRSLSLSGHGIYNCTDGAGFESWSNLTKLQMLDLSYNKLPRSIIFSLAKVSSLRALYLDYNMMGGNVPVKGTFDSYYIDDNNKASFIFSNLTDISFQWKNLTELGALNLEVVSLHGCGFIGSFPDFGHWSSLKALSLAENDLSSTLTSEGLCGLKNLEELDLSFNNFVGNLPLCMRNLSSLKLVDLQDNQFHIKFPSSIFERLMSLWYLSLSNNQFEGTLSMRSFWNHSNLEVLELSTHNPLNLRVQVVDLPFQLQVLTLANCILDVKPTFLYSQHKLQVLDLSNTRSKGHVMWLLQNNTNLIKLDLHKNNFIGFLQLSFLTHEKLSILDISDNHLSGELPANITTKFPNLSSLILSKNNFHGPLPLVSISNLHILDLSFNSLNDDIQNNFPRILPSFHSFLDLSNNNFYGSFAKNFNFTQVTSLLLNDNSISGEIPFSICNTSFDMLDLSNNEINGVLPDCIGSARYKSVSSVLKLSGNNLEGSLPLDLCDVPNLHWLDLSNNKFSGSIPPCSNQSNLQIISLRKNNLTGNFPITWLNNSYIRAIDIGENYLSGELPIWIGKVSNLIMLQARQNMFRGSISEPICQLKYLRILDLSHNNFSGEIPSCIKYMGSAAYDSFSLGGGNIHVSRVGELNFSDANFLLHTRYDVDLNRKESTNFRFELMLLGRLLFFAEEILPLIYAIDLSSNKLVGNIPEDIGQMNWLKLVNLSNNYFSGAIPYYMSNLEELESLDLSHNSLTGEIPRELTKLLYLGFFSVAYNELSGPILDTAQFSTFDNSSYEGNPNLCGPPLSKRCVTTQPSPNDDTDFLILFGSFSLFYVVSFWCYIVVLCFNRNWCYALFTLVDQYSDMIYVKVVISTRKIGAIRTRKG